MIVLMKIYAAGKIFGKIFLRVDRDTIFSNMWSVIRGGIGGLNFFVISNIREKFKLLGLQGHLPIPSLSGTY